MVRHIRRLALWAVPAGFLAVLFYWPLASIAASSFGPAWFEVLAREDLQRAIWFTLWQAVMSTVLCVLIGLPIAFVLYRRRFFGSVLLRTILVVPFVLPSIVVAIALIDFRQFFGGSTIVVILIAHVFLNVSLVVRVVGTSFAAILTLGGGQIQSIETAIYFALTQRLDLQTASALALLQTAITVAAFAISRKVGNASFVVELTADANETETIGKRDLPLVLVSLAFIFLLFVIPLGSLFAKAFTRGSEFSLQAFSDLSGKGARDLLDVTVFEAAANSLRNAAVAAAIAMFIGVLVAWLLARTKSRWPELFFMLPLGVSSVVLGFGYLLTFGGEPLPLRESWLVVPLLQALITAPLVVRIAHSALLSLGENTRDAASNAGADSWQIWRFIETPSIRPALATALGFALLSSLGEFGSSALLAYADQTTLPVVLMRLISRPGEQNYAMAMAASVLLIVLVVLVVSASELIRTRRRRSSSV